MVSDLTDADRQVLRNDRLRIPELLSGSSVPPTMAPSKVMQAIKGRTSHQLLHNFRTLEKKFWGRHLWARGYFVATSGNVTDEVIAKYIEDQDVEPQDDDFRVTE